MQLIAYVQYKRNGVWIPWYVKRQVIIKPLYIQVISKYKKISQWQHGRIHIHNDRQQICLSVFRVRFVKRADYINVCGLLNMQPTYTPIAI